MSKHKFSFSRLCHEAKKTIVNTTHNAANGVMNEVKGIKDDPTSTVLSGSGVSVTIMTVGSICRALGFDMSTGSAEADTDIEEAYDLLLASDPDTVESVAEETGLSVEEVEAIAVLARAGVEVA